MPAVQINVYNIKKKRLHHDDPTDLIRITELNEIKADKK